MATSQPAPPKQPHTQTTKKPRKRGCLWGCLGVSGLTFISCLCIILVPLAMRLTRPPADKIYGAAPDRYASSQVQTILEEANLEGIKVYVIPTQGTDTSTAFIVMDASKGFDGFSDMEGQTSVTEVDDRVDGIIETLIHRNQVENLRITIIALDYRDENGESFTILTNSMEQAEAYQRGEISQAEFHSSFKLRLGDIVRQALEEINE